MTGNKLWKTNTLESARIYVYRRNSKLIAEWSWREFKAQFYVTRDKEFVIIHSQQSFHL